MMKMNIMKLMNSKDTILFQRFFTCQLKDLFTNWHKSIIFRLFTLKLNSIYYIMFTWTKLNFMYIYIYTQHMLI